VVFVPVYALVVVVIAGMVLPGTSTLAETLFFLVTGLLWVLPAGVIVTWMVRPREPRAD